MRTVKHWYIYMKADNADIIDYAVLVVDSMRDSDGFRSVYVPLLDETLQGTNLKPVKAAIKKIEQALGIVGKYTEGQLRQTQATDREQRAMMQGIQTKELILPGKVL